MVGMIQEILTEYIVDEEMNEEDVEFTARALAFKATEGQRGSRGDMLSPGGVMKRSHVPPLSLKKKVTWRVREASIVDMNSIKRQPQGEHVLNLMQTKSAMSPDGSISEAPEESDNSAMVIGPKRNTNSLFAHLDSDHGILMRNVAASEVRTKRE